ncbi:uncharacterized protein YfaS (alpha-2-macroglobulin family) [Lysobacter niastensis]|uniref:Uncharacterized protein YfaS (Alpha-2-macroglobulin family) n=1 Tax=Lysobacter niastensis TaxID=380629 RepID=A0ABU1W7T2_9GAMM|nr:alpha-2-macroglobulin [Lysobacter niastensis]MDR7133410.1 uncharacterized protein YfaS (alpha-2-macroglobulin family) [Lysobacter niastensis]
MQPPSSTSQSADTQAGSEGVAPGMAQRVFGQFAWQPPAWLSSLTTKLRQRPRLYLGALAGLMLVAGLGWWLATRPTPVVPGALEVTVDAPDLTDYTKTPAKIDPLRLTFSGSAAPITKVGAVPEGVVLAPELKGAWVWQDDHTLVFTPAGDWPVGAKYEVRLDTQRALARGVKLGKDEFEFETSPFRASLAKSEFYQDPLDPNLKKGVFEVSFSHPVDAAQFERRIRLQLADGAGTALAAPEKTVSYDERRLKGWVHSAPLQLPENGGTLKLEIAQGVTSLLGGDGTREPVSGNVVLPSLYSVNITGVTPTLVDNERFEPEQVLVIEFNNAMRDTDVAGAVRAWLLPAKNPKVPLKQQPGNYDWSEGEIDEALLKKSTPLPLTAVPTEREYIETHSFKYVAPPNRRVYVRVAKGLKAFGGFILGSSYATVAAVPEIPPLLRFVGDGALLSLRGEHRVSIVSRNVPNARLEIARVLPEQLQHLAFSNEGSFAQPYLSGIEADDLVEREERRLKLPADQPAKAHYEGVDLGEYLKPSRRGVFLLSLHTLDEEDSEKPSAQTLRDDAGEEQDSRLVVLTDLGMIVKKALDGSRDVFIQSLAQGTPVSGAKVRAIARNGETLVEADTDGGGRAHLPSLDDFKREKRPVMLTVSQGEDFSFLPIDDRGRALDFSRFDIGGQPNEIEGGALDAFLFSDRGLYRPGDTIHLGMIVRAADWKRPLTGLPLELVLTDPRGTVAQRKRLRLGSVGFEGVDYTPAESAPSGTWEARLYLLGKDDDTAPTSIGSTSVQVREFAPDTMRVRAQFSTENPQGWVKPDDLSVTVTAENLIGTPAQQRRVAATMVLRPSFPRFAAYPDYRFYDPQRAKEGYDEELTDAKTDNDGRAKFVLDMKKYERATYQLSFLARAYEPGSGRNVAAQASTLVSNNDFLVGIKAQDDLGYVARDAKRAVQLLSIGQDGKPRQVTGLQAVVVERRYVSVLTKQPSGTYRYVSHERRFDRKRYALQLAGGRQAVALPTGQPGDFALEIRGSDDKPLNQIDFRVTGAANLSRALDRNAELALSLSQPSYRPGDTIEVSVRAPYPGSGLITLERDHVFAHVWFRADTTSSVQKIQIPADFEGNGYVNVQFLRDPNSDEIFMSPLSYGVVPFAVDRAARTQPLEIRLPAIAKPGVPVTADITTTGKARVVLFAVDEGILQVARYRVEHPLDHFFKKRMLQVDTAQILDLVLPEFSRLAAATAPGGDSEGDLAKNLNPFKRKAEKPAVWWSGIIDVDGRRQFTYTLPDHFNGQVRVVALAVTPERIGLKETTQLVRGDFVLTPTVPTHLAPGDEFELPVGVANTIAGAKAAADVAVTVKLPPQLAPVGSAAQSLSLQPGREGSVRFRLRAGATPGTAAVVVVAQSGKFRAQRRIEVSVRPAVTARQDLRVGRADHAVELKELRAMYNQFATRQLSASASPLLAVDGLSAYLQDYPHLCTEQLLSQAMPALVLEAHPELGKVVTSSKKPAMDIIDVLRSRQNSEGGIGLWAATPDADPFVTGYAALYLLEAREHGKPVPDDVIASLNRYLEAQAADRSGHSLPALRSRALAVYLLIRQGRTASNLLGAVHEQLKRDQPKAWEDDVAGLFVATSYQLLQQDKAARPLATKAIVRANRSSPVAPIPYSAFYDDGIAQAWTVYLVNKHFSAQRKQLQTVALERLLDPMRTNRYNTLSSALTVLAMDSYANASKQPLPALQAAGKDGKARNIGVARGVVARGTFAGTDTRLWVRPADKMPVWYLLNQSGFDRVMPKAVQDHGLEVVRDYLDGAGKPVATITQGDEITVRLRVRSLGVSARGDIAIVDLLPGGFEPVLQYPEAVAQPRPTPSGECEECEGEEGDESGSPSTAPPAPTLALPGSSFAPQHVEQREDRIVLYGFVGAQVTEFRYRVRAGNTGKFVVAPIFAESMYDRSVYAQGGPAGFLQVSAPKP